ncbi:unnamed protein product [Owenia fusiformis]|uniref:Uncharacterized protein n=1 Tax=Owenia fusiformis TaxID=6347 RepID=A0A8S4NDJ3_OWEFU|nr:unnamed protein product [Owenia fusiformis]
MNIRLLVSSEMAASGSEPSRQKVKQLEDFVKYTSESVDIKNRYPCEQLDKHASYVKKLVETINEKNGEYNPVFKSRVEPCGSYSDNLKIMEPDEFDFKMVMDLSKQPGINVTDVEPECGYKAWGYGYVIVGPEVETLDLPTTVNSRDEYSKQVRLSNEFISINVKQAVIRSLEHIENVNFIGERKLDDPEECTRIYNPGEISIHTDPKRNNHTPGHGPSIWLRVGTELCTTDIDLCFCIEKLQKSPSTSESRKFLIYTDDTMAGCCGTFAHWLESVIDPPGDRVMQLNVKHRQLLLTLKYIVNLMRECWSGDLNNTLYYNMSSYFLKTVLVHHEKTCQARNVGECFENVIEMFCEWDTNSNTFHIGDVTYVRDIHYNRNLKARQLVVIGVVWFFQQIRHSPTHSALWRSILDSDASKEEFLIRFREQCHFKALKDGATKMGLKLW